MLKYITNRKVKKQFRNMIMLKYSLIELVLKMLTYFLIWKSPFKYINFESSNEECMKLLWTIYFISVLGYQSHNWWNSWQFRKSLNLPHICQLQCVPELPQLLNGCFHFDRNTYLVTVVILNNALLISDVICPIINQYDL